ncbi:ATP-binding cassette domain-containing protein [Mycoplasma marinum]|uniref:AAA+ ATPase domain-containing protein n=1 Tax=Mycoplasma marinum TaxID=1937190 RepID=A0A4R0XQW0_9MOLU|nr:AAA family ATPase [Mycoplasma marinum]TCG11275.1 hypothetical protein C4B24_02410 [Mycoplasma marinum]
MKNKKWKTILYILNKSIKGSLPLFVGVFLETIIFIGIWFISNKQISININGTHIKKGIIVIIPALLLLVPLCTSRVILPVYGRFNNLSILKSMGLYKKRMILLEIFFLCTISFVVILPNVILSWFLFKNLYVTLFVASLLLLLPLVILFWFSISNQVFNGSDNIKIFKRFIAVFGPIICVATSFFYMPETVLEHIDIFYGLSFINPMLSINTIFLSIVTNTFHFYYIFPLVIWSLMGILNYFLQYKNQPFISNNQKEIKVFNMQNLQVANRVLVENINLKIENSIIVGTNGVGKTTLLKNMYRYCSNQNSKTYYLSAENDNINVFEHYKPLEIIEQVIKNNKNISKNTKEIMAELEENFKEISNQKISKLSGGQKQIFKALSMIFGEFDLLLIDEFEKSLTADMTNLLLELLEKYQTNATKIFITHSQKIVDFYENYTKILIKNKDIKYTSNLFSIEDVI